MRYSAISILVGGLLASGVAMAQPQVAVAVPPPKGEFVVFADKGNTLSPTALATVRSAASEASSRQVTLVGRPAAIAAVKGELIREGVPAQAIVARPESQRPITRSV